MAKVKSAMGRMVDMSVLVRQNEETVAVSNVRMNARGDRLDERGNVVISNTAVSRVQQDVHEPPEMMTMSETEKIAETRQVKPIRKSLKAKRPQVVSEQVKTNKDGSSYKEIEYDDGSIETIELGDDQDL